MVGLKHLLIQLCEVSVIDTREVNILSELKTLTKIYPRTLSVPCGSTRTRSQLYKLDSSNNDNDDSISISINSVTASSPHKQLPMIMSISQDIDPVLEYDIEVPDTEVPDIKNKDRKDDDILLTRHSVFVYKM